MLHLVGTALAARAGTCAAVLFLLVGWPGGAHPQDTTVLAPEASAAKAREVIQRAIQALGGPAYLSVQDLTCTARYSTFDHNGASRGTIKIISLIKMPDKERIEYIYKRYYDAMIPAPIPIPVHKTGSTIEVHNGEEGWTLAGGGVEDLPPDLLTLRREQRKKNINILFRSRLNEPDLVLRYTGQDTVDLKQVDWVETSDADRYITRIAIDHASRLPVRAMYRYRDPISREPNEEVDFFSNYQPIQGVMTPMQTARERNGLKISQLFLEDIKYNTGLSDSLFTRESLEQLWAKIGKGKSKGKD